MARICTLGTAALGGLTALLAALVLAACSGESTRYHERAPLQPPASQPAAPAPALRAQLPTPEALAGQTRHTSELLSDPLVHVSPQLPWFLSGGVFWGSAQSVILQSPPVGSTYCLYGLGQLQRNDRLLSLSVAADASEFQSGLGGAPHLEYYVLLADFNSGRWLHSARLTEPGTQQLTFPVQSGLVSPSGFLYIAVICANGGAVHLTSIDAQLDFSARAVDHVVASMPGMDSTGVDIHYSLQAVDINGQVVTDFNGTALLASTPQGVENVLPVEFVNGVASPLMRFSQPALYDIWLVQGSVPALNSYLGGIEIYATPLPVYSIFLDPAALQHLLDDPFDDTYQNGSVTLDGKSYFNLGLRFRGDSARWLWKKSWKLKFETGGYDDTEWGYSRHELNLNAECVDPTLMREKLSYQLMEDMGMLAPRARFIHLRVNNVYQGVYCDVEDPGKQLIKQHGIDSGGALYKPQWCIMDVQGDGSAAAYVGPFEKKTREAEPYDDLALLVWNLNNVWNPLDCSAAFKASFDEEGFLSYMVANCLVSDGDQLGKNYILYNEDQVSGQWLIIPWDYDLSWGHHYTEQYGLFCEPMYMDTPLDMGGYQSSYAGWRGVNNLLDRYVYDPVLSAEYRARLAQDMEIYFQEADQLARIDAYYELIREDVEADWQRWVFGSYEERVQELRDYVVARRAFLQQQLSSQ
jgi:spore coat protein CotH